MIFYVKSMYTVFGLQYHFLEIFTVGPSLCI